VPEREAGEANTREVSDCRLNGGNSHLGLRQPGYLVTITPGPRSPKSNWLALVDALRAGLGGGRRWCGRKTP
jgi:hypothetical protein